MVRLRGIKYQKVLCGGTQPRQPGRNTCDAARCCIAQRVVTAGIQHEDLGGGRGGKGVDHLAHGIRPRQNPAGRVQLRINPEEQVLPGDLDAGA